MKSEIFNQYADRVSSLFGLEKDTIFSKSKKKDIVDARYLLYYLCYNRPMKVIYIQKYMSDKGYEIKHSSIIYGIKAIDERMESDSDYITVVKNLQKSVLI
jgi:chromosomal replication initiation ATPase DnaA